MTQKLHKWKDLTPPEKKKPKMKKKWNKLYERVIYEPDVYCPKKYWAEVNGEKRKA